MKKIISSMLIVVFALLACNQNDKESKNVSPKQTATVGLFKIQSKEKSQDMVDHHQHTAPCQGIRLQC
ncbi:MAG: hypothetical protein WC875_05240 [Candidatus Absconditabacterales bacterium]|jgi:PBP1b-binding outer membrane lipoprotein LpoB